MAVELLFLPALITHTNQQAEQLWLTLIRMPVTFIVLGVGLLNQPRVCVARM
ncbi:hypothetical protein [secondary endosymbiont of Ctenarytaina eucalypti]|uniref:Uncharacterized protein n=1 Tax=secondary endosymbiont of Ctenarytaina eucalypti TaxID=1199245 RepID=J3VRU0_9ENTR|nr:hypothetical protein [secondary endosymbiont of Ctenarytaina eucalypti]AFP84691.1 hypothetical protein A359_02950 [secondary endosymbiont of Ctenarytaina eucalypti]